MVLLDTHALHWWTAEPERVSPEAAACLRAADELAVAAITWWELGWLATHERIVVSIPVQSWLERLSILVRTVPITPAVAAAAVALPSTFPRDPADRLIFATARELGCRFVTKDERMHAFPAAAGIVVW